MIRRSSLYRIFDVQTTSKKMALDVSYTDKLVDHFGGLLHLPVAYTIWDSSNVIPCLSFTSEYYGTHILERSHI